MTAQDRKQALQSLRARIRAGVTTDGIDMVWRSRYGSSAQEVAEAVRALGGEAVVSKHGKTKLSNGASTKTWRVVFSVSCPVDAYLGGTMNLRDALAWEEESKAA